MSNEELLNEYETAIAIYIVTSDSEDVSATATEERLNNIKAEILRRMNK